ncbi:PQQ-dependent sugar dehydrogenase [Pararhizobium sp. YC-54]|uniref:PQQ-dependent sugar dehydrogenase n=1 Tax=Pararhizobium sp. YC-54 TaxID=2986920 RepID=UPI0021F7B0F3|nr:PQQ-dependent sugar dehydrogenase [Pararhizobium sp. YC-54]MCW0000007.1 PQQ-dependent sugar dehydrogenase [Pararhizobium sp. YC-54]
MKTTFESLLTGLASVLLATPALAEEPKQFATDRAAVQVHTIASGLDNPWSVEVLPDGAYIVTELGGGLRIIRDGKASAPITGVPKVARKGQGGLLDVALDPGFQTSRTLFLSMSVTDGGNQGTAVMRAVLSKDGKSLTQTQELFRMNRFTGKGQHFGSRIAIAADGSLFFGIGDRGERDRAQDMRDHAGAILHIKPDGSIPADNPYKDGKAGLAELWSKGHRNPQGIAIDPANRQLITVEHGARGGDEINTPEPGKNYGWPVITFGKDYSGAEIGVGQAADGYEQPLYYWDPSIAPGAIDVYHGAMFPQWEGNLLVSALKYQLLARLERDESGAVVAEERLFEGEFGRIRDVKVAPDGSILMLTDGDDGALLRVSASNRS